MAKRCSKCRGIYPDSDRRCPSCGHWLRNARLAEVDAQTPPEVFFCSPATGAPPGFAHGSASGGANLWL